MPTDVPAEDRELVNRDYATFADRIGVLVPHYFLRVWNEGRVDLTEIMWTDDIVFHTPVTPEPVQGRAALLEYVLHIQGAFSELAFAVDDVVASDDRIVMRVTQTGRHTGDYFGLPPTGRTVRVGEVFIFRAVEGEPLGARVSELWLYFNALGLMQQIGLFPRGDPPRALLRAVIGVQKLVRRRGA